MTPPITERQIASTKNWARIWYGLAPTAIRRPISRVRSVTLTSMMFMMPIPPTRSDTAAMLASSVVKVLVPASSAFAISVRLRVEKSSGVRGKSVPLAKKLGYLRLGSRGVGCFGGAHVDEPGEVFLKAALDLGLERGDWNESNVVVVLTNR